MGEAEIGDIGHELLGQFAITQIAALLRSAPRAEMHLVNRDRRLAVVALRPRIHPTAILPDMARWVGDNRGGAGRMLGALGMRIGFQRQQFAVGAEKLVFVEMPWAQPRHEKLPEAAGMA